MMSFLRFVFVLALLDSTSAVRLGKLKSKTQTSAVDMMTTDKSTDTVTAATTSGYGKSKETSSSASGGKGKTKTSSSADTTTKSTTTDTSTDTGTAATTSDGASTSTVGTSTNTGTPADENAAVGTSTNTGTPADESTTSAHTATVDGSNSNAAGASEPPCKGLQANKAGTNIFAKTNPCEGTKPQSKLASGQKSVTGNITKSGNPGFDNYECRYETIFQGIEQAGANVTRGYQGTHPGTQEPQRDSFWSSGMCPVNVHWHVGTEHLSVGEYDEEGTGPAKEHTGENDKEHTGADEKEHTGSNETFRFSSSSSSGHHVRQGHQCHYYNANEAKFTAAYDWQYCKDMQVGQTYEIHWPHSAAGACSTPNQYQTPFYDGVFCNVAVLGGLEKLSLQVGVQAQVFTVVNDESYYYPNLMKGMIVAGDFGADIASYTGSTTGTSRNNKICSAYGPITWQVDRKCHMISASSFDKMCSDMLSQNDDLSPDTHPHGAREVVDKDMASDNHNNR